MALKNTLKNTLQNKIPDINELKFKSIPTNLKEDNEILRKNIIQKFEEQGKEFKMVANNEDNFIYSNYSTFGTEDVE